MLGEIFFAVDFTEEPKRLGDNTNCSRGSRQKLRNTKMKKPFNLTKEIYNEHYSKSRPPEKNRDF